jgi:hypothetical protein
MTYQANYPFSTHPPLVNEEMHTCAEPRAVMTNSGWLNNPGPHSLSRISCGSGFLRDGNIDLSSGSSKYLNRQSINLFISADIFR